MSLVLSKNEKLTLWVSMSALITSILSVYFQFFYLKEEVIVTNIAFNLETKLGLQNDFSMSFGIINNGDTNIAILGFTPSIDDTYVKFHNMPKFPIVIKPSDIDILEYRGNIDFEKFADGTAKNDSDYVSGEFKLRISYSVIGAKGGISSALNRNGNGVLLICEEKDSELDICGLIFKHAKYTIK